MTVKSASPLAIVFMQFRFPDCGECRKRRCPILSGRVGKRRGLASHWSHRPRSSLPRPLSARVNDPAVAPRRHVLATEPRPQIVLGTLSHPLHTINAAASQNRDHGLHELRLDLFPRRSGSGLDCRDNPDPGHGVAGGGVRRLIWSDQASSRSLARAARRTGAKVSEAVLKGESERESSIVG